MNPIRVFLVLLAVIVLLGYTGRGMADMLPMESASESAPAGNRPREAYSSVERTLQTFLRAFPDAERERPDRIVPDAIEAIEFSGPLAFLGIPERRRIALELRSVIDRLRYVDYDEIKAEAGSASSYVLARTNRGSVRLARQENGEWRFTSRTIDELPLMLDDVAGMANVAGTRADLSLSPRQMLREAMPPSLRREFVILEIWQWLALLVVILLGLLVDKILMLIGKASLRRAFIKMEFEVTDQEIKDALRPLGLLAAALVWYGALYYLLLPPTALGILTLAVRVFGSIAFIWAASKAVDLIVSGLKVRAAKTPNKFDDLLVPFLGRVAKVFIVAFSLVFVAQNMGLNITSLLAGLGLGGLAFALAAKDTVENLFGSLTVLLDRPFRVGDWVALPGTNIEGIVDNVGLRSTRIRTFYDSLITVPNATLIRSSVDNYGERRFRRWFTRLGVQYDTPPEKIDAFCEAIRELIRLHPLTRKEAYHVYANEFGDSSLNILLVVFFNVPDWGTELRERHRLFVDIVRIAKELGVQFAFPTRTLHLVQGQNPVYTAIPNDTEQSMAQGRNAARDVLRRTFGEEIPAPPPLRYPAPVSLIPPNDPGAPQR